MMNAKDETRQSRSRGIRKGSHHLASKSVNSDGSQLRGDKHPVANSYLRVVNEAKKK